MSSFYKMDPAAWDFGTAELTLEQEAAYLRIVNAIHKHDAPVPNVDRILAGLFRCSTRKAKALVSALVDAGKIHIEGGKIWNERARSDLVQRQLASGSAALRGSKGGRTRANNAANALKNNEPAQANASSRIEENRIVKEDTNVSSKKTTRGTRLKSDWVLPNEWGQWAVSQQIPEPAVRAEADKFRDYWHSVAGSKGVKLDWFATWRNWCRNSNTPKIINGGRNEPSSKSQDRLNAFVSGARGTS